MRPRTDPGVPGRAGSPGVAAALFVLAAGGLVLAVSLAYELRFAPAGSGTGTAAVRIEQGSDLRRIANDLKTAGVVASPGLFVLAARLAGLERRLHAGDYRLDRSWPLPTLLDALIQGRGRTVTVTIPEGWRLEQIADRLDRVGVARRQEFLAAARDPALLHELGIPGPSAEGFLFPETYPFPLPTEPENVIRIMFRRFRQVWNDLMENSAPPAFPLLETVTLASIVERETADAAERPLVAAVFRNRLSAGMPLQSDPTVIYGLPAFDGDLRRRDLAAPSPYNTYLIRGLPPGPIANPGRASLEAVLRPSAADYLYFVSRNDGTHLFSRTLAEHNRAVARFQLSGRPRS